MIFRNRMKLVPREDRHLYCKFDNAEEYFEYLKMINNIRPYIKSNFTRRELLILWLKLVKGCGRKEIRRRTGISERQIFYAYKKKEAYFGISSRQDKGDI